MESVAGEHEHETDVFSIDPSVHSDGGRGGPGKVAGTDGMRNATVSELLRRKLAAMNMSEITKERMLTDTLAFKTSETKRRFWYKFTEECANKGQAFWESDTQKVPTHLVLNFLAEAN